MTSFATGGNAMIAELHAARDRLDAGVFLLNQALDLREQFEWGVTDLDDATAAVATLKSAIEAHRRG